MGRHALGYFILPTLLAACGGPVETRVSSTGPGVERAKSILREDLQPTGPALTARHAVTAMLVERGFTEAADGELQLQVALSERDAAIAVSATTAEGKQAIAEAKKRKPLQSCADKEFRLSVALTRISDGALMYKGVAAEHHCKARLEDLIPILVQRALADLEKPKGEYVLSRSGLD